MRWSGHLTTCLPGHVPVWLRVNPGAGLPDLGLVLLPDVVPAPFPGQEGGEGHPPPGARRQRAVHLHAGEPVVVVGGQRVSSPLFLRAAFAPNSLSW